MYNLNVGFFVTLLAVELIFNLILQPFFAVYPFKGGENE